MVVGLIVGVVTLVMSLDIRTRMGRVGRFVGAFFGGFLFGQYVLRSLYCRLVQRELIPFCFY